MEPTFGLSQAARIDLQRQAERLVAKYDVDRNSAIDAHESVRQDCRYNDEILGIDQADFRLADKDRDGKLTGKELVQFFLEESDQNHDGQLSFWEKGGLPGGPTTTFERGLTDMFEDTRPLPYGWKCQPVTAADTPATSDISVQTDVRIRQR